VGSLWLVAGLPSGVGRDLVALAGFALLTASAQLHRIQSSWLHASLMLRLLAGDAAGSSVAWQVGGVLNEVAILAFLATMATLAVRARGASRAAAGG
jgi:hypothetical protein